MRNDLRQSYISAPEQFFADASRSGYFLTGRIPDGQENAADRTQFIDALGNSQIQVPPATVQFPLQDIGQHDDKHMPPGAGIGDDKGGLNF